MRIRVWLCEALTGAVVREVTSVEHVAVSSRLDDRGTMSMSLAVDAASRDGRVADWGEVRRRLNFAEPLLYTVVITSGPAVLTEHVIESWTASTDASKAVLAVDGFAWERYPAYRSLHEDYVYSGTNRGALARRLMEDAFIAYNREPAFTVPATWPSGVHAMDRKRRTGYYLDALREIMEAEPGMEWIMRLGGEWVDGDLSRVTRTVEWGWPDIRRSTDVTLTVGAPGTRHGNTMLTGGRDGGRWAGAVYAIGPGQGDKQPYASAGDPTRHRLGSLAVTKNLSCGHVANIETLQAIADQELRLSQELAIPLQAVVEVDKIARVPRPGDMVQVTCEAAWAWPEGINAQKRVGELAFDVDGYHVETIRLQMED